MDCPQKVRHFLGAFFMGKSKYSLEFKLRLVKRYHKGDIGSDSLGKEVGIGGSLIRSWVRSYESNGVLGLGRDKSSTYSKAFKLKVLQIIERENLSINEAARKFNIGSKSSIFTWQQNYEKKGILGLENQPRGRPKTMSNYKRKKKKTGKPLTREEELLERIYYLEAENAILKKLDALIQERKNPKPSKN